jgi:lysophospholipase L1-like esterase
MAVALVLLVISLIAEVVMRFNAVPPKPLPKPYDNKQKDDVLGWKSKDDYHFKTDDFNDSKGGKYSININFSKHGFRKWDTTANDETKPAVFFVGDSYVESLESPDKDLFYSVFADSLPFRVFAAGTAGYGSTQEFLVLQHYVDSINPKYVVLEMCGNDFPDNFWKLEEVTGYKVGQTRPYLNLNNQLEYHRPHHLIEDVTHYSKWFGFLLGRTKNALIKLHVISNSENGDEMITRKGLAYEKYHTSYQITGNCLKNIKGLLDKKGITLFVFVADDFEPYKSDLRTLCKENNIPVVPSVAEEVRKHENAGETVRAFDGYHWNPNGQKIVADELIKYFRQIPGAH